MFTYANYRQTPTQDLVGVTVCRAFSSIEIRTKPTKGPFIGFVCYFSAVVGGPN